jgi:uncharacterized metal-binding protein YceD (DUF177 family)
MCVRNEERYRVPFKGLKEGEHTFDFEIDSSFFESFSKSEIRESNLHVRVVLQKSFRLLTLDFIISGTVRVPCDRCLDEFDLPVSFRETLYVKLGDKRDEVSANTLVIPEDDSFLVISQYIYEYAHLALPLRRVHPEDDQGHPTCNPVMLKKLEELSAETGNNENRETDQRWSVLKNFIKNVN